MTEHRPRRALPSRARYRDVAPGLEVRMWGGLSSSGYRYGMAMHHPGPDDDPQVRRINNNATTGPSPMPAHEPERPSPSSSEATLDEHDDEMYVRHQ